MTELNQIWPYQTASEALFGVSLLAAWLSGLGIIVGTELRRRQAVRRRRAIFKE